MIQTGIDLQLEIPLTFHLNAARAILRRHIAFHLFTPLWSIGHPHSFRF